MTDYKKLVELLRCDNTGDDECGSSDCPYWSGLGCMDGQLMEDAADAIETLQAQLPKRGKWIENGNGTYSCNRCGSWIPNEQHYYARYCLYCGAKMEVQE